MRADWRARGSLAADGGVEVRRLQIPSFSLKRWERPSGGFGGQMDWGSGCRKGGCDCESGACRGALRARQRSTRVRCAGAAVRNVLPYGRTACLCDGLTAGQVGRGELGGHALRGISEVAVPASPVGRVQGHRQHCEDGTKQSAQPDLEVAERGVTRIGEGEKPGRPGAGRRAREAWDVAWNVRHVRVMYPVHNPNASPF